MPTVSRPARPFRAPTLEDKIIRAIEMDPASDEGRHAGQDEKFWWTWGRRFQWIDDLPTIIKSVRREWERWKRGEKRRDVPDELDMRKDLK